MKVKVNKLPEGYKVKGGKIVKVMSRGGAPYNNTIGKIPRQFANLEAEKGETALTDLTQDGNFELYNIGGSRHPSGGTPLSLPPQSFIFSDTAKMKLNKEQLTDFGINSTKKMTPAAVSKKFPLNKFYSALDDEFVDNIGTTSAELMLDKNKMQLSHLAFVSESKKKFEDGLPLAAYPYLMSQDIDPMEFVQKVNKLNEEQAQMQMIDQLPPEQQQQILALQDFTGGQGGPPQGGPQGGMPPMGPPQGGMPPMPPQGGGMPPQGMMPPQQMMAKYGGGLQQGGQGGGGEMEQIMQMVGQAMEQGAQPEEVIAELLQNQIPPEVVMQVFGQLGMPPEQVEQMIMAVMQQVQGGQQQMAAPQGPPQGGIPPEMMAAMQQGQPQQRYGGSLRKGQYQAPEGVQPQMHLPSQRLQEVAEMTPFNAADFASNYPEISYGKDINQGINQGSLVALAEKLVESQNATPDPMYDGRYKDDPQGDYAQKGGMIAAGVYNSRSPHFNLDNMIPAGAYNQPLNRFVYGGEEYIDRYRDYDIPKFQKDGETAKEYATRMESITGKPWNPEMKNPTYDKKSKMWVFEDGTPSVSNKDMRANAMNPDYVVPDMYRVDGGAQNTNGVIIDEEAEEGQGGNYVNGVWVPGPNDKSNSNNSVPSNVPASSYAGQGGYEDLMNLYQSDDWDMINEYAYDSYVAMHKEKGLSKMGPLMSAEEFEVSFLADQKFKAISNDPERLKNMSIEVNGKTVTGTDIMDHLAWDNPSSNGFKNSNDMYRLVYDQIAANNPDAELPPLPTSNTELSNTVRQYQSTFSAFGGLQKHADKLAADGDPSFQNLLKNVDLSATGIGGDAGSGLMGEDNWSNIDGVYGNTYNRQTVAFKNQPKKEIEKKGGCYWDKNKQPIAASVKAEQDCQGRDGKYDRDVCQCIEKTEFKTPETPPKTFWKQDLMKMDALAGVDINKYYPSRQKFTGNFMDPAYKDPTREIAAIGEQSQIAGDLAAQNLSGPALASVLAKIQGTAGEQVANTLNQIQSDNITTFNTAEQFNAGVQTNTDVLNQDASKIYMDAVNLVDQNYDNAKNELNIELADAHANAWTNRANTYNLNTLTPNYNINPKTGGTIDITNEKDFYAQNVNDPKSGMDVRMGMWEDCMARCQGPTETSEGKTSCKEECNKMVEDELKRNSGNNSTMANNGNPIGGGYPGNSNDNTVNQTEEEIKSSYGRELRRELIMRRGGQW